MGGAKTYILALAGGCVTVAYMLGWIDNQLFQSLLGLLGFGSIAALRAGVAKAGD